MEYLNASLWTTSFLSYTARTGLPCVSFSISFQYFPTITQNLIYPNQVIPCTYCIMSTDIKSRQRGVPKSKMQFLSIYIAHKCIKHEYHFWLTTNNATCEHNVVPLLHRTEYCSIQLASPSIQNQWMLRRNCKSTKEENFLF